MATRTRRVPTLVSSLNMDVLENLGMKLNPRHPLKDFRFLAGKMGYNFERVRNFEREKNPTLALISDWYTSKAENGDVKTVTHLIKFLRDMKRDDAVELLIEFEYTDIPIATPQMSPMPPLDLFNTYAPKVVKTRLCSYSHDLRYKAKSCSTFPGDLRQKCTANFRSVTT